MDETSDTRRFPTVAEARRQAVDVLTEDGWTPVEGQPGQWMEPTTGAVYAVTYHPHGHHDAQLVSAVKLLLVRAADRSYGDFIDLLVF